MESLKQFFNNLMAWVGRMTPSQVVMLLGVGVAAVVALVMVLSWFNSVSYARLYGNLDESEAGEVISYLNDKKIPYELSDGGRTIEVPSTEVYQLRISLASEGLPRSGSVGYSIFDDNNLGMTDFLQNLNFRRALEGELTRTIMQLSEVQAARVHIVMPKERLFKKDQQQATASVVLKLRSGGALNVRQVRGISHLVAASVEGLKPDNITVVDYDGNLLSGGQQADALAGLSASQLEVRKQVEQYLEDKSQTMLDDVLGAGKAVIRVTAELNFQQVERTSETFDPNTPSIRSEERTKASLTLSDKAGETDESQKDDATETTITNYELNKSVEHIVNAVGTINRLSVAVMVDGNYEPVGEEGGDAAPVYQPRSQEELDRLAAIVQNAIGFDSQRNDQIEMFNIAFDRSNFMDDRQKLDSMYLREFYMDIASKVGLVLLVIVGLLYMRKKARRLFQSLGSLMPPRRAPATAPASTESLVDEIPDEDVMPIQPEARKPRLVDQMQKTAKDRPDEIARVIKTLMID